MTVVLWIAKIAVLVYTGLGAYLYVAQRSFMYFPTDERESAGAQTEYLDSAGERLKVWVLAPGKPRAVIYLGGNAEDVSANIPDFRASLPEHTVYLLNYRGYGGSSGSPTQTALFEDALNLFDTVAVRHKSVDVVGRSLGTGVATYLASERPVGRLILATPYDSARAVAQDYYPLYPMRWMLKDQYESDRYAAKVESEVLLLVAGHDNLIPPVHADRLLAAFPQGSARLQTLPDAGHNDISGFDAYWRAIEEFLRPGHAQSAR